MGVFEAFVLGLVQGVTEFLPISSSAHLILVPWLFGWEDAGLGFDVALHWGTLAAVLLYFRGDVRLLVKGFWHSWFKATRDLKNNIYQKLSWLIIIASIPAAAIGKLFERQVEGNLRNPLIIAVTLSVFGVVLLFADTFGVKKKNLDRITKIDALTIGLSQALALIPGISRSGSTMTAGLALGFRRADAARFSFLMSIPIILGAGLLKLPEFHQGVSAAGLLVGFVTAAISGFLSIKYLLRLLAAGTFQSFVWYRVALAVIIITVYLL